MNAIGRHVVSVVIALFLVVAILWSANLTVKRITESSIIRRSQILGSLMSENGVGFADIASNPRNLNTMTKFAAALADAYIQFEFIPTDEAKAILVIMESLDPDVHVDGFEFHSRDLLIYAAAPDMESYHKTLRSIQDKNYFENVSGVRHVDGEGQVIFTLTCRVHSASG